MSCNGFYHGNILIHVSDIAYAHKKSVIWDTLFCFDAMTAFGFCNDSVSFFVTSTGLPAAPR